MSDDPDWLIQSQEKKYFQEEELNVDKCISFLQNKGYTVTQQKVEIRQPDKLKVFDPEAALRGYGGRRKSRKSRRSRRKRTRSYRK